jgi:hypothetical protein
MNRKGSIYFLTLSSAVLMMTMVLGLSVLIIKQRRVARVDSAVEEATICAELGIRHALYFTKEAPNWRTLLSSGSWMDNVPNGPATYSLTGIDSVDGDLQNSIDDPVEFTCTATVGGVQRALQVQTEQPPLGLLNYAVATVDLINILDDLAGNIVINGDVASNGDIAVASTTHLINGNAEAGGTIGSPANITGTNAPGSAPKTFPDGQAIIQYYTAQATTIPFQSEIRDCLLSPTSNPYGATNPNGVYRIDCADQKIVFKDCRVVGTIILVRTAVDSTIESAVNWQPARADYPVLITDRGRITIQPDKVLAEADRSVDYSLPGEPGAGNQTDVYPNLIKGVIYGDRAVFLGKNCAITGTVISRLRVRLFDNATVTTDPLAYANPPQQFKESYLVTVQGSWQEVASAEPDPGGESALPTSTTSSSTSSFTGGGGGGGKKKK